MSRSKSLSDISFQRLIFRELLARYGPQHWWPGDTPFEIALGAILTQNTSWRNVEIAIDNLKKEGCLSPPALSRMSAERLGRLIRSAGFYRIKAKRVKEFVRFLMRRYDGAMGKMKRRKPGFLREELLQIKGIGPETCDSILLYALQKPVFVVDAYTRRILSRHGLIGEHAPYDEIQRFFETGLERDAKVFNEYHALLVRLGKERCRSKHPRCDGCPLEKIAGVGSGQKQTNANSS